MRRPSQIGDPPPESPRGAVGLTSPLRAAPPEQSDAVVAGTGRARHGRSVATFPQGIPRKHPAPTSGAAEGRLAKRSGVFGMCILCATRWAGLGALGQLPAGGARIRAIGPRSGSAQGAPFGVLLREHLEHSQALLGLREVGEGKLALGQSRTSSPGLRSGISNDSHEPDQPVGTCADSASSLRRTSPGEPVRRASRS